MRRPRPRAAAVWCLAITLGVVPLALRAQGGDLVDVLLLPGARQLEVELLTGAEQQEFDSIALPTPPRFVIDLLTTRCGRMAGMLRVDGTVVRRVRIAQFQAEPEPICRVVFDLEQASSPRVESSSSGLRLLFRQPRRVAVLPVEDDQDAAPEVVAAPEVIAVPDLARVTEPLVAVRPLEPLPPLAAPLMPLVETHSMARRLLRLELRTGAGGSSEVELWADGELSHSLVDSGARRRIIIEIPGIINAAAKPTIPDEGIVSAVYFQPVASEEGSALRVLLDLRSQAVVRSEGTADGLRLSIVPLGDSGPR